ncbi:MAG: MBL fold metallo-hydrolase [Acidobacteria bacterium]|nr:MBL fold metallo-hydrolase [Acidobacteriota bacterium]
MHVWTTSAPPFYKNGYVVACERTRHAIVIDPGDDVSEQLAVVKREGVSVTMILLTHAHLDHVTGVGAAKGALGVPVWLHSDDLFLYERAAEQGRMFGLHVNPQPKPDRFYVEGESLAFGDYVVDIRHTPGHCPGGVCLAIGQAGQDGRELFVGDTLFAGSIGRTDLPGGDLETLLASIRNELFVYPDSTLVHSGHGPDTTIGEERRGNPFLQ